MIRRVFSIVTIFFAVAAQAQNGISVAPIVSFDFGKPLFINRSPGALNPFGIVPDGSSAALSYGLGAELTLPNALADHIGLTGSLEGIYSTGNFTFNATNYTVSGIDRKLLLGVSALWNVKPFALRAGPWVSQAFSRNVYENDPNGIRIASGDSITSARTHIGISVGLEWHIPDFPIHPELWSFLDLSELSQAGLQNVLSVGLSIGYDLSLEQAKILDTTAQLEIRATPSSPPRIPRVRFLVNGSEAYGNPPLERVEMHVKQYAMVDSANASPVVTQWVEESYHLPHLALRCMFDRRSAGYLMILKDSLRLMEYTFDGSSVAEQGSDTTLDLENDVAWNNVLNHLNTGESNHLIAELRTNKEQLSLSSDTLVLPAVDALRATRITVRKQFRFVLSDNYRTVVGGEQSLELLLGKIRSMLDPNTTIRTFESPGFHSPQTHSELLARIHDVLGHFYVEPRMDESLSSNGLTTVILEN